MPIRLPVEATADDRAFQRIASRYEKWGAETGKKIGAEFSKGMGNALEADSKQADKFDRAYSKVADTMGKVRVEEAKLQDLRSKGASDTRIIAQAEALERARRAEARATREAAAAFQEYEQAAESAGRNGGQSFLDGLRDGILGARAAGRDAGGGFAGAFASASALKELGSGVLKAGGWITAGVAAGKLFAGAVADGMATIQMQDLFQARMGLDEASMAQYAQAAGKAYAGNFGQSVEDNLETAKAALQSGLIDTNATGGEVQAVIEQLQGLNTVTDASAQELSLSMTTLMRTGLAGSVSEASDIIVAGFQNGLDVSGDWLDTINEYSTQFRKLGLTAPQVLTLLKQGFEGGARDTDKVADSMKEFSIRAVDGSKATREGFEALGFSADDMAGRVAAGGDSAQVAFSAVLEALRKVDDPMQQQLIWQRLFGTQWEDLGKAINKLDLDPAKSEFGDLQGVADRSTKTASDNFASDWESAARTVKQRLSEVKTDLANWVTDIPWIRDLPGFVRDALAPSGFGPPAGVTPPSNDPTKTGNAILSPDFRDTPDPGANGPAPSGGPLDRSGPMGAFYDTIFGPAGAPPAPGQGGPQQGTPTPILTDAEASEAAPAAKPNIPLSQYSLDAIPFGQFQGETGIKLPGRKIEQPHAGPGYYEVDPQAQFDAETQQMSARQRLEEARRHVLDTAADNDHTEAQMQDARNSLLQAQRAWVKSQQDVLDAQQGTWKNMQKSSKDFADGMDDISAQLDEDFGISKGLPGIAENVVKFLGSLAFVPVVGAMKGVQAGLGFPDGSAGSGVAGMIGSALGLAKPQDQTSGQAIKSSSSSTPVTAPSFAAQPGESARDFAHRAMMPFWQSQGLEVGDHGADQHGEHQNGALDIMVPSIEAGNAVLQQVLSDPNVYGAIFNNQTYGYGNGPTPQDYSAGHTGDPNQDHTNHVHAWYKPGDPNNINPNGAPVGMGPSAGINSSGATPVFVVNMPGSGLGGPTAGAGGPGKSDVPASGGSLWDQVAQAESAGNWQDNNSGGHTTSSGAPRGGLQITDGTWAAYGGNEFAPTANLATKEQQQAIANRIAFGGHGGTAPQGLGAWQSITDGKVPGVTTATPASAFGVGGGPAIAPAPGIISAAPPLPGATPSMGPAAGSPGQGYPLPWNLGVGPGAGSPGAGSPGGLGTFTGASSVQGGREMGAGTPASGGLGLGGGLIGLAGSLGSSAAGAAGMATMGMDGGAGGAVASAAMQIGIQEGMRAISYAGQLAGIGVGGLMETFSLNDSALADPGKSWLGRIAMGVAGARPALPNTAGASGGTQNENMAESGKEPPPPPGSMDPTKLEGGAAGGPGSEGQSGAGGNTYNNTNNVTVTSPSAYPAHQGATIAEAVSSSQMNQAGG